MDDKRVYEYAHKKVSKENQDSFIKEMISLGIADEVIALKEKEASVHEYVAEALQKLKELNDAVCDIWDRNINSIGFFNRKAKMDKVYEMIKPYVKETKNIISNFIEYFNEEVIPLDDPLINDYCQENYSIMLQGFDYLVRMMAQFDTDAWPCTCPKCGKYERRYQIDESYEDNFSIHKAAIGNAIGGPLLGYINGSDSKALVWTFKCAKCGTVFTDKVKTY